MVEQTGEPQADIQALQRKNAVLDKLVDVSLVMNSTLAFNPLLEYIMTAATEITGAEAASILLVDKNTQELRFAASRGSDSEGLAGIVVPMEGSIAGAIIAEDRAMVVNDVTQDPRHFQKVGEKISFQTRSLLGVPMRIKEKLIGVLEVLNKIDGGFNDDDVRHITILASQAAVAIENAQLVSALRRAYEDLNALDKLKSDFIAIASHELRTPLGIILGYASFLKDEAEGTASEHADAVLNSALHLRSLIESMTNLQYVHIDKNALKLMDVPISNILYTAHADIERLAKTREGSLELNLPAHEVMVHADPLMMAMALTNILNNAIKFTPPDGRISIDIEERPAEVWVRVQDTGAGLAAHELENIFFQFYQVEDPMTRAHNGLGLGLPIAKAIVERHGGRIWAESPGLGKGSTFTITIPLAEAYTA